MTAEEIKWFTLASIISADNNRYTEEQKQEVIYRYKLEKDQKEPDWEIVLDPIEPDNRLFSIPSHWENGSKYKKQEKTKWFSPVFSE